MMTTDEPASEADDGDLSRYEPESEAFRLGRATWLLSTLLKLVNDGQVVLSGGLEDSIREFVEREENQS